MICKQCQQEGKQSNVYHGVGIVTAAYCPRFYDEKGVEHHHDINFHTQYFNCSNNHTWTETTTPKCPAPNCNFNLGKTNETNLS